MRRMKITKYLAYFLVCVFLNSCVVLKPDSNFVSAIDYNQRKNIKGAHYHKRMSWPGITLSVAGIALGAYAGYETNLVVKQDGENTVPIKPVNALIGAMVGYSCVSVINHIMGVNKRISADNPEKWIRKVNSDYMIVPMSVKLNDFMVINPDVERSYQVKTMNDVIIFNSAFPNSTYSDDVVSKSMLVISRDEKLDLLKLFPKSKHTYDIKLAYIESSYDYYSLVSAVDKFSELNYDPEKRLASYIKNLNEVRNFKSKYPNSTFSEPILLQVYQKFNRSDLFELIKIYPDLPSSSIAKKRYVLLSEDIDDALLCASEFPEVIYDAEEKSLSFIKTISDVKKFVKVFPNTKNQVLLQRKAVDQCNLSETASLIKLFPNSEENERLKTKYINKCKSVEDYIIAMQTFPDLENVAKQGASKKANSYSSLVSFKENFNSATEEELSYCFEKIINDASNAKDIPALIELMPTDSLVGAAKTIYVNNCSTLGEYKHCISLFPEKTEYVIEKVMLKLSSASSISDCKTICNEFPELFNQAEKKAYSFTSNTSSYSCKLFLNNFPNGAYSVEASQKHNSALRYEAEQERLRQEEIERQRRLCWDERNRCLEGWTVVEIITGDTREDTWGHLETHYTLVFKNGSKDKDLQYDHTDEEWEKYGGFFGDDSYRSSEAAIKSIVEWKRSYCKKCY